MGFCDGCLPAQTTGSATSLALTFHLYSDKSPIACGLESVLRVV